MSKVKIVLEYQFWCTPSSIYRAVSTEGGLCSWFADKVNVAGDVFTFFWNKQSQTAVAVKQKTNHYIRFKWDFHEDYYFEFKIVKQELTGDVSLIVTDYADADDYVGTVELWNLQVRKLKNAIGCAKKL